ncbi:putative 3'; 5'-cyclic-nucleotide phosphodiesterase regA [Paratrimastix pyriformis]|uniref:3 n=1 Tax=Paratrimastix pyriformis TaxID=342808 RepID=A0ABQ8UK61_9EUKA|nr:putative 3'; 5'-cyclic-nucleotide phosphodiesterase regA [Paratrimastix pyriformis]
MPILIVGNEKLTCLVVDEILRGTYQVTTAPTPLSSIPTHGFTFGLILSPCRCRDARYRFYQRGQATGLMPLAVVTVNDSADITTRCFKCGIARTTRLRFKSRMLLTRTRLILEREWLRRAVSGLQAERRLRAEQNADDLRTAETLRGCRPCRSSSRRPPPRRPASSSSSTPRRKSSAKRKVTSLTWRVVQLSGDKAPGAAPVMSSLVDQAEIAELQRKLTKAVETPSRPSPAASPSWSGVRLMRPRLPPRGRGGPGDLQKSLSILSSLSTSDLYRPVFSRLFTVGQRPVRPHQQQQQGDKAPPRPGPTGPGDEQPTFAPVADAGVLKGWDFNVFGFTEDNMLAARVDVHRVRPPQARSPSRPAPSRPTPTAGRRFNIPVETLRNFLTHCRRAYRKNPYHSFLHAFDVTQTLYLVLTKTEVMHYLTKLDVRLPRPASADLDHPGTNNLFQVNAQTPLALVYNDMSALENYHARTPSPSCKPRCNILENLTPAEYREMRKSIIAMILATDLSAHFTTLTRFTTHTETAPFSRDSPDDRQLLLDILLHAAVRAPCPPRPPFPPCPAAAALLLVQPPNLPARRAPRSSFDMGCAYKWDGWRDGLGAGHLQPVQAVAHCQRWSELNAREFFEQGDMERKKGLPVSPYMDRGSSTAARFQVSLIDYCISPTFAALTKLLPELQVYLNNIHANRMRFSESLDDNKITEEDLAMDRFAAGDPNHDGTDSEEDGPLRIPGPPAARPTSSGFVPRAHLLPRRVLLSPREMLRQYRAYEKSVMGAPDDLAAGAGAGAGGGMVNSTSTTSVGSDTPEPEPKAAPHATTVLLSGPAEKPPPAGMKKAGFTHSTVRLVGSSVTSLAEAAQAHITSLELNPPPRENPPPSRAGSERAQSRLSASRMRSSRNFKIITTGGPSAPSGPMVPPSPHYHSTASFYGHSPGLPPPGPPPEGLFTNSPPDSPTSPPAPAPASASFRAATQLPPPVPPLPATGGTLGGGGHQALQMPLATPAPSGLPSLSTMGAGGPAGVPSPLVLPHHLMGMMGMNPYGMAPQSPTGPATPTGAASMLRRSPVPDSTGTPQAGSALGSLLSPMGGLGGPVGGMGGMGGMGTMGGMGYPLYQAAMYLAAPSPGMSAHQGPYPFGLSSPSFMSSSPTPGGGASSTIGGGVSALGTPTSARGGGGGGGGPGMMTPRGTSATPTMRGNLIPPLPGLTSTAPSPTGGLGGGSGGGGGGGASAGYSYGATTKRGGPAGGGSGGGGAGPISARRATEPRGGGAIPPVSARGGGAQSATLTRKGELPPLRR